MSDSATMSVRALHRTELPKLSLEHQSRGHRVGHCGRGRIAAAVPCHRCRFRAGHHAWRSISADASADHLCRPDCRSCRRRHRRSRRAARQLPAVRHADAGDAAADDGGIVRVWSCGRSAARSQAAESCEGGHRPAGRPCGADRGHCDRCVRVRLKQGGRRNMDERPGRPVCRDSPCSGR